MIKWRIQYMFVFFLDLIGTGIVVTNNMFHQLRWDLIWGICQYFELSLLKIACPLHHMLLRVRTWWDIFLRYIRRFAQLAVIKSSKNRGRSSRWRRRIVQEWQLQFFDEIMCFFVALNNLGWNRVLVTFVFLSSRCSWNLALICFEFFIIRYDLLRGEFLKAYPLTRAHNLLSILLFNVDASNSGWK